MSDRLKFRAFYQSRFIYKSLTDANYYDKDNKCIGLANTLPNNLKWEQSTGLKDKNGKLVYEGDLIKVPDDWEKYGMMAGEVREVYYKDGGFRLKPTQRMINIGCRGHWIEENETYEIIGNIHENSEFLNADNA